MPKELEDKLKREYGKDSTIPYKIMSSMGLLKKAPKKSGNIAKLMEQK